ncbi:putative O-glycosylation ligase, exosortase A system-associated [Candidatus Methylocalor cossyra]|uniref:O-glycosylation ligase (Exosortase A-associated) n=1 Tax=Candidatus Methylocalor cossyra TaxID=3108543 RepID=A0ABP1CB65_9GAMM
MRDIVITVLVFGSVPLIIYRPYIGILVWSWLGYMNPHRLCWGFAVTMPFAQTTALAIIIGTLISKEDRKLPVDRVVVVLVLFILWMFITTVFALNPTEAWGEWNKVWKIQLMTFFSMVLIKDLQRLKWLIWTIAVSLGYYGIKGGIFTILTGGNYKVWGPASTFIGGNNEIGLALIMTIPLLRFLQMQTQRFWLKAGLLGAIGCCAIAILGTHSRGALLGLLIMGGSLILKGKNKFFFGLLALVGGMLLYQFMPESWHERMGTIKTYEKDGSAMGRINAWGFAINVAKDRLFGGGFGAFDGFWFQIYAPNPDDFHDAHSIYFEVLGEHGFIGLALFLLLGFFTWQNASRCIALSKKYPDLQQLGNLMRMVQVSLVGYASSGAFLGLAYFDFYYHLVAVVVIGNYIVNTRAAATTAEQPQEAPANARLRELRSFVRTSVKPERSAVPSK